MLLAMQVIGNLGNDAIVKNHNGKSVVNFSVAHTEKFKDAQGILRENTTWVECSMWEKPNIVPYLKKGTMVHINGRPKSNAFVNKEGELRSTLRCEVMQLQLLGAAKKDNGTAPQNTPSLAGNAGEITEPMDDLPF